MLGLVRGCAMLGEGGLVRGCARLGKGVCNVWQRSVRTWANFDKSTSFVALPDLIVQAVCKCVITRVSNITK